MGSRAPLLLHICLAEVGKKKPTFVLSCNYFLLKCLVINFVGFLEEKISVECLP